MAFSNKEMAIAVATVLFLVVAMAPQWTEAQAPQPMPAVDPECTTSISKIGKVCFETTSVLQSKECCNDLKTISKRDEICLCNNFVQNPHPLYTNVSFHFFFNATLSNCGALICKDYFVPAGGSTKKIAASMAIGLVASLFF